MHAVVLGAGSWGTALAILLARNGHSVVLAGRDRAEIESLKNKRENARYLPGQVLPDLIEVVELGSELGRPDMTVIAVPSGAVREVAALAAGEHPLVVLAAKGLESGTSELVSQVVLETISGAEVAALSGPNLAVEIVRGIPTAAVAASTDLDIAERVRVAFMCPTFRVYLSQDVVGVELAGALKNVLAIGAGMSDGLGFGDNTKGALLSRGLHEMTSLGLAMGAKVETFLGLAGVGDLFATAVSRLSRNYRVGRALGEGQSLQSALEAIGQVAEGVTTAAATQRLATRFGVPMPVFEAIDAVVQGRLAPLDGVRALMERTPRCEGFLARTSGA